MKTQTTETTMTSPTKAQIDELALLELEMKKTKEVADRAKKLYDRALAPIAEYVDTRADNEEPYGLRGTKFLVEFGKKRSTRKLLDPRTALSMLERVKKGLGFANISIPIGVLDEHLRAEETKGLYEVQYGARSVKVTEL